MNAIKTCLRIMIIPLLLASCVSSKKLPPAALKLDRQGHRGARGLMPENTIPSMYAAIDLGVTTVEVDVVVSRDSQVVVSHEGYFHELITTTPEGKMLSREDAVTRLLYQMNYDSIRKYDVGLKPHPEFPRQKKIAAYKPTLAALIDSTDAYAQKKGRAIRYNIEMKSDPKHDGLHHPPVEKFTDMVVEVIRKKGIANRCNVQSFDKRPLQIIHRKHPDIALALLVGGEKGNVDTFISNMGFTPVTFSPHFSIVDMQMVKDCREKGMKIIPWTVNTLEEMQRLAALGVDGIITDYPDLFYLLRNK